MKFPANVSSFQAIRNQCYGGPGDRPEAKNVAIVITDGVPYPDDRYQPAIEEAENLRNNYGKIIKVYVQYVSYPSPVMIHGGYL